MGSTDTITKQYMRRNDVFADVFNFLIYDGEPVIDPAKLTDIDTTELAVPYGGSGEYLSGFYAGDRLMPVITLVVYFGADEWTAPLSLRGMMDVRDPRLSGFIQDYRINLIGRPACRMPIWRCSQRISAT